MGTVTTPATVQHTTDALAAVFAAILQDSLVDPRRLLRAATLLDDCERLADGRWICPASDGKNAYHIMGGLCNCSDATYRDPRRCAHALAVKVTELLERRETDAEQLDADEEIGYELTPRALAIVTPDALCRACDGHTAKHHDGPAGACSWQGVDSEGWWQCDCQGFQTDEDAA